jgi:hypothetical protein
MNPSTPVFGFVYVATGTQYVEEAMDSARSIRRFHSEPICLITNADVASGHPFDSIIVKRELTSNIRSKLAMDLCPYDRFIFLDSDTRAIAPVTELFQLLDAFDVCVPASLGGYHYQLEGVSPAFREPSTNVIGFKKGPPVTELFEKWRFYFNGYENEMGREWDQRSFRHAAYAVSSLKLCFLGDEWSLSPYPGGLLCRDVRVLHGRPVAILDEMEATVNEKLGYRVFWRGFSIMREPYVMGFGENLILAGQFFRNALKCPIRHLLRILRIRSKPL